MPTATIGLLTVTLTEYAPKANLGVIVPTKSLSLTTYAPVIKLAVIPGRRLLSITTFAPAVKVTGWNPIGHATTAATSSRFSQSKVTVRGSS